MAHAQLDLRPGGTFHDGGPVFNFTPANSFVVHRKTRQEVDYYCQVLLAGGEEGHCAWLTDQFGISWQIVPDALGQLLSNADPATAGKVMQAMLQMKKIDSAASKQAHGQV